MPSLSLNGRILSAPHQVHLQLDGGRISRLHPLATPPASSLPWILPPLFDLQVNGFAGIDFQQDNLSSTSLLQAVHGLQESACAFLCPTLITAPWPAMIGRLRHLRHLTPQHETLGAAIRGWHLEGPFLSPETGYRGAHNPASMTDPTAAHIEELSNTVQDDPLLLTVAPERPGVLDLIHAAKAKGWTVSLGHTNASTAQIQQAVQAGASGFTHLGNGCPQSLHRHDNILIRALDNPHLTAGLIPDTVHLPPPLFRILCRSLAPDRIYLTTDAMAAAGAPPGSYPLGELQLQVGSDQIVRQPGQPNFAGSALRPLDGVIQAANMLCLPWPSVWKWFSTAPAALLGQSIELSEGREASFCSVEELPNGHLQGALYLRGKLARSFRSTISIRLSAEAAALTQAAPP